MFLTTYPLISLYTHNGDGTIKKYYFMASGWSCCYFWPILSFISGFSVPLCFHNRFCYYLKMSRLDKDPDLVEPFERASPTPLLIHRKILYKWNIQSEEIMHRTQKRGCSLVWWIAFSVHTGCIWSHKICIFF